MVASPVWSAESVAESARRPLGVGLPWRYFAWLAAWTVSAWVGAQIVDWSFAPFIPRALVFVAALAWFSCGVKAVVEAFRRARSTSVPRRVLLFAAIPVTLLLQPWMLASSVGPPTDIRMMTEFDQRRLELDRLAAAFRAELAACRVLEVDAPLTRARAETDALAEQLRRALRFAELRRTGPCFELLRWSHESASTGFEVGFLYSELDPDEVPVPIERVVFLRDGLRSYHRLDGCWYLFRSAW